MNDSKIEWTDKTWNPITGCTKVSQGCKNCYAEKFYERFHGKGSFMNVICHEDRLWAPLKWKKPSLVFVNSMSDLFHEDVPFSFIHSVINTIAACPQHTFQVLTKRSKRMVEYWKWFRREYDFSLPENLWLGVSVENQKAMKERVPDLIEVEASVKFLSCEPLLGPLQLPVDSNDGSGFVDWVIVGGESGPGARPMHPDWVRSLRDQCQATGTAFFFKQWGEYYTKFVTMGTSLPTFKMYHSNLHFKQKDWVEKGDRCVSIDGKECKIGADFQNCAYPVAIMNRVGKKKAGRELDGNIYSEFPVVNSCAPVTTAPPITEILGN